MGLYLLLSHSLEGADTAEGTGDSPELKLD